MKKKLIHLSGKSVHDFAQIFRTMKLIMLFLFVAIVQAIAADNNNELTIISRQVEPVMEEIAQQQGKKISGKVSDQSGMPIPGASVVLKGTTTGTVTDNNGNFILLNVPDKGTLVCSFVGMTAQEIEVGNKTEVNFVLSEVTIDLEEVVAI